MLQGSGGHGSYSFSWNVNDPGSGNVFGHKEAREGAASSTEGEYFVHLPDGRIQTVTYTVSPHSGYQARVVYSGGAKVDYETSPAPFRRPSSTLLPAAPPALRPPTTRQDKAIHSDEDDTMWYVPDSYVPAPVTLTHLPVYNKVVPDEEKARHYVAPHPKNVRPWSPPPPSSDPAAGPKPQEDPYLRTEDDLSGQDFSDTFYYISTKKIKHQDGDGSGVKSEETRPLQGRRRQRSGDPAVAFLPPLSFHYRRYYL